MRRSFGSSISPLLTLLAVACSADSDLAGPDPEPTGPPAELLGSAIQLRVDMKAGKVTVEQPSLIERQGTRSGLQPSFALLGDNEVSAVAGLMTRSAVGEFTPNRVRATFDLTLTNNLENSDLAPSTFPTPPVTEVVAFPFATEPAGLFGWKVRASPDWDIAPHNFFNDGLCLGLPTPPADCFRSEALGPTLEAGASATRRVGFDVDPSVTSFTVYVAVAADIDEQPTAGTGTIEGRVSSTLFGPLEGAIVTASPGGQSTTSDVNGAYILTGLAAGTHSITVTGTPASCFRAVPALVGVETGMTASADFELRCRRIAFTSFRDVNLDIYVMDADGTGQTRLTDHAAGDENPTWSPDGSKLAFARQSQIYLMNADGSSQERLGPPNEFDQLLDPAWSPDGSKIANEALLSDGRSIITIRDPESGIQLWPHTVGTQPAWSADGSRLTFVRSRIVATGIEDNIFSANLDGLDLVQLTFTNDASQPAWSPDGTTLAFTRNGQIHLMNALGAVAQLTHGPGGYAQPAWSPDGSKLLFVSVRDGNSDIYVMNADGTDEVRLTTNAVPDRDPAW